MRGRSPKILEFIMYNKKKDMRFIKKMLLSFYNAGDDCPQCKSGRLRIVEKQVTEVECFPVQMVIVGGK